MHKKKARKLSLSTETLHQLTLRDAVGAMSNTECVTACLGTCHGSGCGSCLPCTVAPCATKARTCPC